MAGFLFAERSPWRPRRWRSRATPDGAAERCAAAWPRRGLPAWDEAALEQALRALADELWPQPGTLSA
jgi:hypothetical protein